MVCGRHPPRVTVASVRQTCPSECVTDLSDRTGDPSHLKRFGASWGEAAHAAGLATARTRQLTRSGVGEHSMFRAYPRARVSVIAASVCCRPGLARLSPQPPPPRAAPTTATAPARTTHHLTASTAHAVTQADHSTTRRSARCCARPPRRSGKPYVYGAAGPHGFDCSGLVRFVFLHAVAPRRCPTTPPRSTTRCATSGAAACSRGDLVFVDNGGYISHVGIYDGHHHYWWVAPHTGDARPAAADLPRALRLRPGPRLRRRTSRRCGPPPTGDRDVVAAAAVSRRRPRG